MSRLLFHQVRRALAAAVLLLLCLPGCQNRYPDDLHYPVRTDLLFVKAPEGEYAEPFYPRAPGKLDEDMKLINEHGGKTLDPNKLPAAERKNLQAELEDVFGTPAWPEVWHFNDPKNQKAVTALRLDDDTLEAGSDLYRRHCLHCHGLTGDGRGPTGPWLSPSPRDYRKGVFKFVSNDPSLGFRKARRADLRRTLDVGVEGTSMPSFNMLSKEEREQLVSYVLHLSIRGETEQEILKSILTPLDELEQVKKQLDEANKIADAAEREAQVKQLTQRQETLQKTLAKAENRDTIKASVKKSVGKLLKDWVDSQKINEPRPYPYDDDNQDLAEEQRTRIRHDSIRRGYELFIGNGACVKCHLDFGREVPFRYDDWGTLVRPANLTAGVYRGGRRPVDLYWRITGGIPPSGMPAAQELLKEKSPDHPTDDRWDVVNFVRYLPYPHMLPEDVKQKIYGPAEEHDAKKGPEHAAAEK